MRRLRDEKGIALVMVLLLAVIALALMAGLIYMITAGTQVSGIQKRYKTAYEAGMGGGDVIYPLLGPTWSTNSQRSWSSMLKSVNLWSTITTPYSGTSQCTGWSSIYGRSYAGIDAKILTPTSSWSTFCSRSLTIDPNTSTTYDISFELGTSPQKYRVYSKIVNTIEGTSGADEGLWKSGVVTAGDLSVQKRPYLYTIEIDAENPTNPAERAKLSVLYQY